MMTGIDTILRRVKDASRRLALVDAGTKNRALGAMSEAILKNSALILKANAADIGAAESNNMPKALVERLSLGDSKIRAMAKSLSEIARLKDPVGRVIETRRRPNGLLIKKITVPIGVILIIYESRPNVTSDCAGLSLKSSNACILRGGREAINSNIAIYKALSSQLKKTGLPEESIFFIKDTDRSIVDGLLSKVGLIDLVIPRGGESLISEVSKKSRIPVIKHYKGVCHTYVDASADLDMAADICYNAKVDRPGVCNAMETMLVGRKIAKRFLPMMLKIFMDAGVEIRGCEETARAVKGVKPASEDDWYNEYLDLIINVKVVRDVDEAVAHIMKYGSYHSDCIVTGNKKNARMFLKEVDSACVYVNASTRFTDGGQFGKGAEIGISTDKIHARGPMGVDELVSYKYIIRGSGQIRA